jgi:hypothetical protein
VDGELVVMSKYRLDFAALQRRLTSLVVFALPMATTFARSPTSRVVPDSSSSSRTAAPAWPWSPKLPSYPVPRRGYATARRRGGCDGHTPVPAPMTTAPSTTGTTALGPGRAAARASGEYV